MYFIYFFQEQRNFFYLTRSEKQFIFIYTKIGSNFFCTSHTGPIGGLFKICIHRVCSRVVSVGDTCPHATENGR